jgi:peptidylprolyl isomerase
MFRLAALAFLIAAAFASPAAAETGSANTLTLETTKGRIVVRLRADLAPKHAERLMTLAREKFYDNVPFHRVIPGFMAQTGDGQRGDGTGGSKYSNLPAEFSNVPFRRGVVGMARRPDGPNTANSQFFIMFAENSGLNGQYTVIGEVISGMDVVDKLNKGQGEGGMVANPDKILRAIAGGS